MATPILSGFVIRSMIPTAYAGVGTLRSSIRWTHSRGGSEVATTNAVEGKQENEEKILFKMRDS